MIPVLPPDPGAPFPPVERALREPDGLLCAGGDLSPARLLNAYRNGIFPWFNPGEPILWWSPDPRMVFRTEGIVLSSKFRRGLRQSTWALRADTAFAEVMRACATSPRPGQRGTWIGPGMIDAYVELHRLGHAHSVEVFDGERLVGGIYGVAIGRMFYGESMFSGESGGSKVALAALARLLRGRGWPLIDAQVESPHLRTLGAELVPRPLFAERIAALVDQPGIVGPWTADLPGLPVSGLAG
ncbi:MAG: leucyl/phenylalanyl-tRNA--protein transferase [Proteobacteria bacterium]|nr:leucyl/phenylalanyl-tRNA--protein transferase [Pseudomonadota bacterium]